MKAAAHICVAKGSSDWQQSFSPQEITVLRSSKRARYIILKIVEQIHELDFGKGLPLGIFECLCVLGSEWGPQMNKSLTWLMHVREIPFKHITSCNLRLILPNYRSNYDFVFSNWKFPSRCNWFSVFNKRNNTSIQTRILRQ